MADRTPTEREPRTFSDDELVGVVALVGHMGLTTMPPKDERDIAKRMLYAFQQLDLQLIDRAAGAATETGGLPSVETLTAFYHWLHKDEPGNELTVDQCMDVDRCWADAFLQGVKT